MNEEGFSEIQKGTFHFADVFEKTDTESIYYYSDEYFLRPSRIFNRHLCTMSLNMCMAFFPSTLECPEYREKIRNAAALLGEIGFEDFRINPDFEKEPGIDTLGMGVAHKTLTTKDGPVSLILINFRGAGYGNEWASNIILGEKGEAEGFGAGNEAAVKYLKSYISEYGDKLPGRRKYWIAGYSRMAAVANLMGAYIADRPEEFLTCENDIFVYTFESPLVAEVSDNAKYECIHNTVNPTDLVPRIPPAAWGFSRYGQDHFLPSMDSEEYRLNVNEVISRLAALNSYLPFGADKFKPLFQYGGKITPIGDHNDLTGKKRPAEWWYAARQDEYLDKLVDFMSRQIVRGNDLKETEPSERRRQFCGTFQSAFSEGARVYFGTSLERREGMRKTLTQVMDEDLTFRQQAYLYVLLYLNNPICYRMVERYLGKRLTDKVKQQPEPELGLAELAEFGKIVHPLVYFFIRGASRDVRRHRFAFLSTLAANLDSIAAQHAPEVTLAWMQTLDSFYKR